MSLYTIIIPCHNNCKKSESFVKKFNNVIIGHNGCEKQDSFAWSNKAKTINYLAKKIDSEYIVVMDSDITLPISSLMAFEREMKKGVLFGGGFRIFRINNKKDYLKGGRRAEYNGTFWFIKTDLLKKYPIPEDVLVEDTAYYEILKRNNINHVIIDDAVVYINYFEKTMTKQLKQLIRYRLGALQLIKLRIYKYSIGTIGPLCIFLISLFLLFYFTGFLTIYILSILFLIGVFFLIFRNILLKNSFLKISFIYAFNFTIAPIIAIYLFIRKKKVW